MEGAGAAEAAKGKGKQQAGVNLTTAVEVVTLKVARGCGNGTSSKAGTNEAAMSSGERFVAVTLEVAGETSSFAIRKLRQM